MATAGRLGAMVQRKSITAKLGAGIYFRAAARAQSIADTVSFNLQPWCTISFFAGRITLSTNGFKKRGFELRPITSGLPPSPDILGVRRNVSNVPKSDISPVGLSSDLSYNPIEVGL